MTTLIIINNPVTEAIAIGAICATALYLAIAVIRMTPKGKSKE